MNITITSASFPKGAQCRDVTEAEYRTSRPLNMVQVIRNGAADAVKADPHTTRDMPQCQWIGSHRYDFDSHTADGQIVERCMDCKTMTRIIPDRSDKHRVQA